MSVLGWWLCSLPKGRQSLETTAAYIHGRQQQGMRVVHPERRLQRHVRKWATWVKHWTNGEQNVYAHMWNRWPSGLAVCRSAVTTAHRRKLARGWRIRHLISAIDRMHEPPRRSSHNLLRTIYHVSLTQHLQWMSGPFFSPTCHCARMAHQIPNQPPIGFIITPNGPHARPCTSITSNFVHQRTVMRSIQNTCMMPGVLVVKRPPSVSVPVPDLCAR